MNKIDLKLSSTRTYPIIIKNDVISRLSQYIDKSYYNRQIIVITQSGIDQLYGNNLRESLLKVTSSELIHTIFIDDNESAKSYRDISLIYDKLLTYNCNRDSIIIGFGGGVVGDIAGFIASTYLRGIDLINIPTTLLSMIDSSIGGKNGINHIKGKNMIGTFYQPSYTFIDSNFLKSVPKREIISGLGEAIKYAIILDCELFEFISNNLDDIISLSNFTLIDQIIKQCIKLKVNIIESDPYDYNQRRVLNFGHTIGHALESYYKYKFLLHGEAVLFGILGAINISYKSGNLSENDYNKITTLINKIKLPHLVDFDSKKVISHMINDKKIKSNKLHFVLLDKIGKTQIVNNISKENIESALDIL